MVYYRRKGQEPAQYTLYLYLNLSLSIYQPTIHPSICTYTYTHRHTRTRTRTRTRIRIRLHLHLHLHLHKHTHIHICIPTHIHNMKCIHIHTHIRISDLCQHRPIDQSSRPDRGTLAPHRGVYENPIPDVPTPNAILKDSTSLRSVVLIGICHGVAYRSIVSHTVLRHLGKGM